MAILSISRARTWRARFAVAGGEGSDRNAWKWQRIYRASAARTQRPAEIREARAVDRRGEALETTSRALSVRSADDAGRAESPRSRRSSRLGHSRRSRSRLDHRLDQRARKAVPAGIQPSRRERGLSGRSGRRAGQRALTTSAGALK